MDVRFSVAIPAYNCSNFLAETLDAVLNQDSPPSEVIVIDDGSTDETASILRRYSSKVRTLRIDNSGPGVARKKAIESARNKWIALCDSDDVWNVNHLSRLSRLITTIPAANVISSNFRSFGPMADHENSHFDTARHGWLDRYGKTLEGSYIEIVDPYKALLEFNPIYPSGMALTREIYRLCGGIREMYSRWPAEDSEFIRRLAAGSAVRLILDTHVSWNYRRYGSNFSETQWKNVYAKAQILEEHLARDVVPEGLIPTVRQWSSATRAKAFDIAYWTGHYSAARELHSNLPREQRSLKRLLRYYAASLREILAAN